MMLPAVLFMVTLLRGMMLILLILVPEMLLLGVFVPVQITAMLRMWVAFFLLAILHLMPVMLMFGFVVRVAPLHFFSRRYCSFLLSARH